MAGEAKIPGVQGHASRISSDTRWGSWRLTPVMANDAGRDRDEGSGVVIASDVRHPAWLRDQNGDAFTVGIVLHTGPYVYPSAAASSPRLYPRSGHNWKSTFDVALA
jgi:hypothetical protein